MTVRDLKPTKPLAGYVRVSRVGARDNITSPDDQRAAIEAHAAALGREVVVHEPELDVSGSKSKRPILDNILAGIAVGHYSGVVVYRLSRLSRLTPRDRVALVDALDAAGADLISTQENLDRSTPEGRFAFDVFAAMARMEWERYAEQFEASKAGAVARGIHVAGTTPFGYVKGADRRLALDASAAPLVAAAFKMRAAGASLAEVAAVLDAKHPGGPTGKRGRWHVGTIRRLLSNAVYTGEARQGEHVNADAHEAIVDARTFALVAAVNASRGSECVASRGSKPVALLAGLVKCATCGGPLTRSTSNGYGIYRCSSAKSSRTCDAPVTCSEPGLDAMIESLVAPALAPATSGASSPSFRALNLDSPEIVAAHEAIETAQAERDGLNDARVVAALGADGFAAAAATADERLATARDDLDNLVATVVGTGATLAATRPVVLNDGETYATLTRDRQREAISSLLVRVEVERAPRGTDLADRVSVEWHDGAQPVEETEHETATPRLVVAA